MSSIFDQKNEMRSRMIEALRGLEPEERKVKSERLARALWSEERFIRSRQIFCYISMPEEPDTRAIIRRCLAEGKKVVVPKILAGGTMEARIIDRLSDQPDGDWVPGAFGILEPNPKTTEPANLAEMDCVLVPGLAFDAEGRRLGRGKGYYDRFFEQIGPSAARIALAFECQRVSRVPCGPHDEKVDLVLYA
jgi:5-formyltetrahydrofolate cyclo-ligase